MTIAAITLVSFLGGAFLMLVHNLDLQIGARHGNVQFQVFWSVQATSEEVRDVWSGLSAMEGVVNVRTFTPDQALGVLAESFRESVDLEWMKGRSPLPHTAMIECETPGRGRQEMAAAMVERLRALPQLEKVHDSTPAGGPCSPPGWALTRMAFWPVTGFLLLVVALVVGNTIKLALLARREELEILRFVGASRAYIQFPLLVGGAFQGILGAGLALGLLKLLHNGIEEMFNVPPLWMTISFLPPLHSLTIVATLAAVGVLSSLVALRNSNAYRGQTLIAAIR
jgi:cell division transport system permease protein